MIGAILNYSTQLIESTFGIFEESYDRVDSQRHLDLRRRYLRRNEPTINTDTTAARDYSFFKLDPKHVRQSLMFLIHFIGDIHQPLHVSRKSDKGGNDIKVRYHLFEEYKTVLIGTFKTTFGGDLQQIGDPHNHHSSYNLHSIWDTAMIQTAIKRNDYKNINNVSKESPRRQRAGDDASSSSLFREFEESLELYLKSHLSLYERIIRCQSGSGARAIRCAIQWGKESWERALQYAYTKGCPSQLLLLKQQEQQRNSSNNSTTIATKAQEVVSGDVIDEEYYNSRLPIIKEQLIAAGVRLAATLEDIFGSSNHSVL